MNIFTTLDENYYPRLRVFARTLKKHTNSEINLTILHFSLSNKKIVEFTKISQKLNINTKFVRIEKEQFSNFKLIHQITTEAYTKLLVLDVFPNEDKALWIDVDTIVLKDISTLYNENIDDYYVMGTPEAKEKLDIKRLSLEQNATYFNAGVILFNLNKIRKDFSSTALLDISLKYQPIIRFADQDVVNIAFSSRVKRDENKNYNFMIRSGYMLNKCDRKRIKNDVVIIHFIRHIKPWHYYYQGNARYLYLKEMFFIYPIRTIGLFVIGVLYKLHPNKKTLENSEK